jgi:Na+/H+ antiporter NhaD/arsenite permease-like protein
MTLAIAIFAAALAVVASDRVHRTKVALVAAALVVLTGTLEQEQAIEAIDFNTIGLLAGMMLIVRVTEPTGVYNYVAIRAGQLSRGRPMLVVLALAGTTAILSAFLDNLTTVLLVVPITFLLADALDIDPIPLVIIEIIASNIGGTATLIGDPPNILIAGRTDLSFNEFLVNLAPVAAVAFVVVTATLYLFYRSQLQVPAEARERVMEIDARKSIEDMDELKRTMPILGLTIVAFFLHNMLHIEPATVALTGAAAMLLVTRQSVEEALAGIEWATLFFFLGLFVLVGGLEHTGAIDEVADGIASLTDGDRTAELMGILGSAAFGSAIVDNIPFTAAMLPVVEQLQQGNAGDDAYWWALSIGACFGGNATLIAAAANVAAAGMAQRAGRPIGFVEFLKVGLPATVLSLAIGCAYVLLRYVA